MRENSFIFQEYILPSILRHTYILQIYCSCIAIVKFVCVFSIFLKAVYSNKPKKKKSILNKTNYSFTNFFFLFFLFFVSYFPRNSTCLPST